MLKDAGVGPKTIRILRAFWDRGQSVPVELAATMDGSSRLGKG